MNGIEQICFRIISAVGSARSSYIEAIKEARKGRFDIAQKRMEEGREVFVEGHQAHAELLQQEAGGSHIDVQLLLVHAEDQLMSAEGFSILARELIETYRLIYEGMAKTEDAEESRRQVCG